MPPFRAASLAVLVFAVPFTASLGWAGEPPAAAPAKAEQAAPIYDEKADAAKDIAQALAAAKRDHSRVLVQWGANWCGWCKLLHRLSKDDPAISRELLYEYNVVLVDVGRFDKHLDLAERYGADLKGGGLPYLTILDESGTVIINQETGALEKPKGSGPAGHDPTKVLGFLKTHQATPPAAEKVLADGLAAAGSASKRAFVHFGAPWCGWCHRLEAWMAKPEVAAILAKEFVDVKIDTDRMDGGQALLDKHSQGKSGGIPWFEILAADGTVLATSTGPDGNIGFPAKPDEIAWFTGMLRKSATHLGPDDIAALEASLAPPAK